MSYAHKRGDLSSMYTPEPNTGCWLWLLSENGRGYGRVRRAGRTLQAHRVFYEEYIGPIAPGMDLDHKCRVTFCVNPDHLEPVPHIVNVRRGRAGQVTAARQKAKTHCLHGHEFSGDNLIVRSNGARSCRACIRLRDQNRPRRWPKAKPGKPPQTHCKNGHPLVEGPDCLFSGKLRICLICRRARDRKRQPKRTAARIRLRENRRPHSD